MKRMLKQLTGMMAAVLLAVSYFPMEAMAAGGFSREYERLMDMADLLTEEEEEELIATLDEIREESGDCSGYGGESGRLQRWTGVYR